MRQLGLKGLQSCIYGFQNEIPFQCRNPFLPTIRFHTQNSYTLNISFGYAKENVIVKKSRNFGTVENGIKKNIFKPYDFYFTYCEMVVF